MCVRVRVSERERERERNPGELLGGWVGMRRLRVWQVRQSKHYSTVEFVYTVSVLF